MHIDLYSYVLTKCIRAYMVDMLAGKPLIHTHTHTNETHTQT